MGGLFVAKRVELKTLTLQFFWIVEIIHASYVEDIACMYNFHTVKKYF